ncbi:MAG: hypothetical protein ACFFCZ_11425 [Promethearchaeota archaeon]
MWKIAEVLMLHPDLIRVITEAAVRIAIIPSYLVYFGANILIVLRALFL